MKFPKSIQNLIDEFSCLPGVGPKTAERYVFYLLKQKSDYLQKFSQAILKLKNDIVICSQCHSVAESNPCEICSDKNREQSILCLTANTRDMKAIENSGQYNGLYHVLGGLINTIEEIGPEKLTINSLIQKIKNNKVKELIIALNFDMEGETTALYIKNLLKDTNIKISRLAQGLPMGSDIKYADDITIGSALKHRQSL